MVFIHRRWFDPFLPRDARILQSAILPRSPVGITLMNWRVSLKVITRIISYSLRSSEPQHRRSSQRETSPNIRWNRGWDGCFSKKPAISLKGQDTQLNSIQLIGPRSLIKSSGVDIQGEYDAYAPPVRKIHKFGQLNLRKIIKIVATRCHILRLKCTKFDFGWGSAPDPAGGAHSAPPDPLAGFKGSYF